MAGHWTASRRRRSNQPSNGRVSGIIGVWWDIIYSVGWLPRGGGRTDGRENEFRDERHCFVARPSVSPSKVPIQTEDDEAATAEKNEEE